MLRIKKTPLIMSLALLIGSSMTQAQASNEYRYSLETEAEKKQGHKAFTQLTGYQSKNMDELMDELMPEMPMATHRFDNSLPNLLLANLAIAKGSKWEKMTASVLELAYTGDLPHSVLYTASMKLYNEKELLSERATEIMVELYMLAQVHAHITDHQFYVTNGSTKYPINSCQEGPFSIFRSNQFGKWAFGSSVMFREFPEESFRALAKLKKQAKSITVLDTFPLGFSTIFFENYRVRENHSFDYETVKEAVEVIYDQFVEEVQTTMPHFDCSDKKAFEFDFSQDDMISTTQWWR